MHHHQYPSPGLQHLRPRWEETVTRARGFVAVAGPLSLPWKGGSALGSSGSSPSALGLVMGTGSCEKVLPPGFLRS